MDRKLLTSAITAVLAMSAWTGAAMAQDQTTSGDAAKDQDQTQAQAKDKKPKQIAEVVVTGSLIPQAQVETANPVTTITAEDIRRQGFRNVSDALRAQPVATGAVQDNQFSAGFTPGATTVSLLGLDPGFTLILIDGRPMADYPLLYNGQSNFTDLSSIPAGMVERIDILPGNQSAIYGSAAIAGVVNIVLKKDLTGNQFNIRVGGYDGGGGDNVRLQFTGGKSWDALNLTYGLQYSRQKPIWGYQRSWYDSTNDNPNPNARYGSRTFLILDGFTGKYYDPGQATCDALSSLYGGTTQYDTRPGSGNFCGSRAEPGYATFLNKETGLSGYLNGSYDLNGTTTLYGTLLYSHNRSDSNSGPRFWSPDINGSGGYIFNADTGGLDLYQHIFAPEETGPDINTDHTTSDAYNLALGVKGTFGDSYWDYNAYYARSQYNLLDKQQWPLTDKIEDFFRSQFLGPQLGTYYGYAVYVPDNAKFYQALTPEQYASFQGGIRTKSTTWTHNFNFQVTNTDLFELPAGSVGFAGLLQAGYQTWNNPTDPGLIAGDFWGLTGTQGSGKRSSQAVAVEFRVPIFQKLQANVSGRYDRYKNIDAGKDSKATWKLGLEYRPIDTLLLRANYATAFRAPDMSYIYAGESGFFTSVTDYYRCATNDPGPIDDCTWRSFQVKGSRTGNLNLKSITADSFGYGFVWSPNKNFDLRADYYNIRIDNEVSDLSIDRLLRDEAACRAGEQDINSPTCVDALARITRVPGDSPFQPNALLGVRINPINISNERTTGIIAGTSYRFDAGRVGNFEIRADYNQSLDHSYQRYPEDPTLDLRRDYVNSSEFKSVLTGDVIWNINAWTTTVHAVRFGSTPNYTAQLGRTTNNGVPAGTIAPYMLYNLNVDYQLSDNSTVTLTVNNVFNRRPPVDLSYTAYPYYNIFQFNGYGRAFWLQYNLNFGSGD